MSTPAPFETWIFTAAGFLRTSTGAGISGIRLFLAAFAGRDRISVRASFRVAEECADALIEFGADDVLEFAGLVVGLGVLDGEGVFEQPLSQAMAPDNVARTPRPGVGQLNMTIER